MNLIYIRQDIQVEFLFMVSYCYSTAVHYKPAGCQTNRNFWRNFHINSIRIPTQLLFNSENFPSVTTLWHFLIGFIPTINLFKKKKKFHTNSGDWWNGAHVTLLAVQSSRDLTKLLIKLKFCRKGRARIRLCATPKCGRGCLCRLVTLSWWHPPCQLRDPLRWPWWLTDPNSTFIRNRLLCFTHFPLWMHSEFSLMCPGTVENLHDVDDRPWHAHAT